MPKEFGRNRRVAQFIKAELSVLVQREFPLNQYGMITITNVDVSPNLANATVLVTILGKDSFNSDQQKKTDVLFELNQKQGYFRQELSHILTSKGVPHIEFKYDNSIERGQRLSEIINSVKQDSSSS